jgi:hypothetical protein
MERQHNHDRSHDQAQDLQLIKEFVLLPIAYDALERDIRTFEAAPLKVPAVYIRHSRRIQRKIDVDLSLLRTRLKQQGIKVYEAKRTPHSVEAEYIYRGYRRKFAMVWGVVKAEVLKKLSLYMEIDLTSEDEPFR